jgi:hypothetical protein
MLHEADTLFVVNDKEKTATTIAEGAHCRAE